MRGCGAWDRIVHACVGSNRAWCCRSLSGPGRWCRGHLGACMHARMEAICGRVVHACVHAAHFRACPCTLCPMPAEPRASSLRGAGAGGGAAAAAAAGGGRPPARHAQTGDGDSRRDHTSSARVVVAALAGDHGSVRRDRRGPRGPWLVGALRGSPATCMQAGTGIRGGPARREGGADAAHAPNMPPCSCGACSSPASALLAAMARGGGGGGGRDRSGSMHTEQRCAVGWQYGGGV